MAATHRHHLAAGLQMEFSRLVRAPYHAGDGAEVHDEGAMHLDEQRGTVTVTVRPAS